MFKKLKVMWKKFVYIPEDVSKKKNQIKTILETQQHKLNIIVKDVTKFQKYNNYNITMSADSIKEMSIRFFTEKNMAWDDILLEIRKILMHINKSQNNVN